MPAIWGCRRGATYFPETVEALRRIVDRFIEVLDCLDTTFINAGFLDRLPRPGRLGDDEYACEAPSHQKWLSAPLVSSSQSGGIRGARFMESQT